MVIESVLELDINCNYLNIFMSAIFFSFEMPTHYFLVYLVYFNSVVVLKFISFRRSVV